MGKAWSDPFFDSLGDPEEEAKKFDLFHLPQGYFDFPYTWYRLLRDYDPVHQNSDGTVLLTRYDDVRTLWKEVTASVDKTEMFSAKFGEGPLLEHHTQAMLFRDPPDHDRLRAIVSPFLTAQSLTQFSEYIETLIGQLLDQVQELREFDFVTDFAAKIPVQLITRVLGIPPEDGEFLRSTGARVLFPLNPLVSQEAIESGHRAVAEFSEYLIPRIKAIKSKSSQHDPKCILEALIQAQQSGVEISDSEIVHMCLLVFNGGHETTTNLMAVGTDSLVSMPDQYKELAEKSDELGTFAIEEIIRYVTPLQLQGRRITKPMELPSGVTLAPDTEVIISQASANRDERAFEDPHLLNLRRRPNNHVAFGLGIHSCAGISLARLESRIMFPRLAKRFPALTHNGVPIFNQNVRFRGLKSLPMTIS